MSSAASASVKPMSANMYRFERPLHASELWSCDSPELISRDQFSVYRSVSALPNNGLYLGERRTLSLVDRHA